ncbi:MAG: hypothetical protein HYZ34_08650 [Ignavibacteriae bacterium]|nr:hypothetical protein [Ignavibacteriota bacterium]
MALTFARFWSFLLVLSVFSIKHQGTSIKHQGSSIKHRVSSIEYQASRIKHPASNLYPQISFKI